MPPAPHGNQFWKAATSIGRDKLFADSDTLWEAACEYFEWVEKNPLKETKAWQFQGEVIQEELPKMRAMTIEGLYLFLGIGESTWYDYKNREGYKEFSGVIKRIEYVIRSQKFSGAAADLLNANIIARDLGLKDAASTEHTGTIALQGLLEKSDAPISPDKKT